SLCTPGAEAGLARLRSPTLGTAPAAENRDANAKARADFRRQPVPFGRSGTPPEPEKCSRAQSVYPWRGGGLGSPPLTDARDSSRRRKSRCERESASGFSAVKAG